MIEFLGMGIVVIFGACRWVASPVFAFFAEG
jgi:hypothetical protein